MKEHWRVQHQWLALPIRPSSEHSLSPSTQSELAQNTQPVLCQRLFSQGPGSSYFAVHITEPEGPVPEDSAINRLFEQLETQHQKVFSPSDRTVEITEINEATPWLRRTRWTHYLAGQLPDTLYSLIHPPDPDPLDPIWRIHQAVAGMARTSQQIAKHCGHLIRVEIVRTESDQAPKAPLQAYMAPEDITHHVRPWQQIISFFARTQQVEDPCHPPYRFNHRQRQAWNTLWRLASSRDISPDLSYKEGGRTSPEPLTEFHYRPLETACLDFCLELLNQRVGADEYECALVCALAVLGQSRTGWQTADTYSPLLSKVIKIARFMVLGRALWLDPYAEQIIQQFCGQHSSEELHLASPLDDPEFHFAYDDEGYQSSIPSSPSHQERSSSPPPLQFTQAIRRRTTKTFQEWVKLMMKCFMIRGTNTPMQWILDLRTYAMKVSFNSTQPGHIGWLGTDRLLYKHLTFTMGDLRGWVHGLTTSLENLLSSELLLLDSATTAPLIPWASLADDPSESSAGWSFLKDSRTAWPVRGDQWLVNRIRQEPSLQQRFLDPHHSSFRTRAVQRYIDQVCRFREKLGVLIHLCGGQPGRAPELLSIRHRNTENAYRNIFIEDGLVVLAVRYHKGFYISNDVKIIHRYLPRAVGALLVQYLWLVLPLIERFDALYSSEEQKLASARTALLWGPDPLSQRAWSPERLRDAIQRESKIGLGGQMLNIAAWRDIAIAISRRFLRTSSAFGLYPTNPESDEFGEEDTVDSHLDLQAGHSSHVAGMVYARQMQEAPGTVAFRRTMFRNISQDWHKFLGFPADSLATVRAEKKRKRAPWEDEQQEDQLERRFKLAETKPEEALQHFMGSSTVRFRGIQKSAIQAIQQGFSPIVTIMPTGGGKSLLFLLPAWIARGLTVVVVPLIALRTEFQERCLAMGISCVPWESHHPPDEASIVLVTPESALTVDFRTFLHRQQILHRLDRIVVDECHQILNARSDFRPDLALLGRLLKLNVQMIFLTATLPPSLENRLWSHLHHPREKIFLYRDRTTRANIAYRSFRPTVDPGTQGNEQWLQDPRIQQLIQDRQRRAGSGRTIVYASTVRHVTLFAQMLGCEAFHGKQIDKEGILTRFRRTANALLVATSALGMGMDIPDIRTVIHIGWPYSLLDYAQETGRAGRDGQPSEAILIQPRTMAGPPPWIRSALPSAEEGDLVRQWLEPRQPLCRRVLLDQYLDGYSRTQCQEDRTSSPVVEELCEVCSDGWSYDLSSPLPPRSLSPPSLPDTWCASISEDHPYPLPLHVPSSSGSHSSLPIDETLSPVYQPSSSPVPFSTVRPPLCERTALAPPSPLPPPRWDPSSCSICYAAAGSSTIDLADLESEVQQWARRCWVCAINALPDDHELIECTSVYSYAAQEWYQTWRSQIQFARFSCCYQCVLPQRLCLARTQGVGCQYPYVVLPMIAMMFYGVGRTSEICEQLSVVRQAWYQGVDETISDEGELVQYLQAMADTSIKQSRVSESFLYLRRQFCEVLL
ncbi:unnamed protein product [Penicillium pancosmium]